MGNTVLDPLLLQSAIDPYAASEVDLSSLFRLRDDLTLLYIRSGYVTSGAVLTRERSEDGFAEFDIVEGRLGEVRIAGVKHYRADALERLTDLEPGTLVHMASFEKRLRRLQDDPRIESISARLVPGSTRGAADLELTVQEGSPYRFELELNNDHSPAVGERAGRLAFTHLNLTGSGDSLYAGYEKARGHDQISLEYERPWHRIGSSLRLRYMGARSRVIEGSFGDLGFHNRSAISAVDLRLPWHQGERSALDWVSSLEYRRSQSSFSGPDSWLGPSGGTGEVAVFQLAQELTLRGSTRALTARSAFRWGMDVLGGGGSEPDGQFFSWIGQVQWAQRLPWRDTALLLRGDLQLSPDALPALEEFSIGGHASVRGFRENRRLGDQGWIVSAELRLPLWRQPNSPPRLELAPFFDIGQCRDRECDALGTRTLSSAGIGVRVQFGPHLQAELYWAHAFQKLTGTSHQRSLQDRGFHFRMRSAFR